MFEFRGRPNISRFPPIGGSNHLEKFAKSSMCVLTAVVTQCYEAVVPVYNLLAGTLNKEGI